MYPKVFPRYVTLARRAHHNAQQVPHNCIPKTLVVGRVLSEYSWSFVVGVVLPSAGVTPLGFGPRRSAVALQAVGGGAPGGGGGDPNQSMPQYSYKRVLPGMQVFVCSRALASQTLCNTLGVSPQRITHHLGSERLTR